MRPFYSQMREELLALENIAIADFERIEQAILGGRSRTPLPPAPIAPLDTSGYVPDALDQGDEGDCAAFAFCAGKTTCEGIGQGSRSTNAYAQQFAYWVCRMLMGTTDQDSGSNLGDMLLGAEQSGTALANVDPYVAGEFATPPSAAAFADAKDRLFSGKAYPLILDIAHISLALADGYPVLFGFGVWQGFESGTDSSGAVPDPDGTNLGGHANLLYFDPAAPSRTWADLNSWGQGWGRQGKCWWPQSGLPTIMEAYALVHAP